MTRSNRWAAKLALLAMGLVACFFVAGPLIYYWKEHQRHYEAGALSSLQALHTMQVNYMGEKGTYAESFVRLGVPLGASLGGDDLKWGGGYSYRICDVQRDSGGRVIAYSISARPLRYQIGSKKSYLEDQTGTIFMTGENRAASRQDKIISH